MTVTATATAMPAEFDIPPLAVGLAAELQRKIDQKTKPSGSLGELESLALRLGLIQQSLSPQLHRPTLVVCAADHGAAQVGVSAYPAEVTAQMVLNFLAGGAAINVFAAANGLELLVVDAGVDYDFGAAAGGALKDCKIAPGTHSYLDRSAMSKAQCRQAVANGERLAEELHARGCNLVGCGEMGIGNTASAALLTALLLERPLVACTGPGTGLDRAGLERKVELLERAAARIRAAHGTSPAPLTVLAEAGGFEIATLCGLMLGAARRRMAVLVDGFIVGAALLVAQRLAPALLDYCLFSHRSAEPGHTLQLEHFNARPLLDMGLRLGEGSGAALAYPLLRAAVGF